MAETRGTQKSLLCTIQEQNLLVNAIKYSIDKASDTSLCGLYNEKTESIAHILSACSILAKSQCTKRH